MKSNIHFALALAGLSVIAMPAAAANAAVTIAQGSDYVMVSDGGAMTSASANQTIGEGQMFAVTADNSVMVSQGEAEYALDAGTYSVGADGALLDAAGNPVADAGAGTPGPAGAGAVIANPLLANIEKFVNPYISTSTFFTGVIGTGFISGFSWVENYYSDLYFKYKTIAIGPYGTATIGYIH